MSYSGYKSSSRGSRGFSRGGYRGSSRGGNEGSNWRGGGRGYTSSPRGSGRGIRFSSGASKWDRESGSYEPRSRYNTGGERYSSHGREEGSYRYRGDDSISSYTSRDHSHRSSSPDRKRMRTEYIPASSMHRSHDYGDGIEYSSRSYGGYEGKRISSYGGGDERRVFREERERIRSDDYQFRKPMSVGGPRHSTPRGLTYRGRIYSRGLRSGFRRPPSSYRGGPMGYYRNRIESYGIRKRIVTNKTQEYLRRLKMLRIQSLRKRAAKGSDDEDEEEDDDGDDEEEEEIEEEEEVEEEVTDEEDNEEAEGDKDEKEKKEGDENEDEEGGEEKKEEPEKKKKKVKKLVKVIKKVKRKVPKRKISEKDKDDNSEEKDIHVTVKQDSEGRDVDTSVRKTYLGQPFMKLECPHCHANCITFKDYMVHLYSAKHQAAMTNLTLKVRKALAKMRLEQRTEQRDLDEECKLKKMNMRSFFCLICKLNYRSLKSEHLESDKHLEMKNFLNPSCKICRVSFRSPMMYENHLCSLVHIKRKYYFDKKNSDKPEENELDMDKYMILDQVGSGEEEESETSDKEDKEKEDKGEEDGGEEGNKDETPKKPKKKKKEINLGSEFCKKIEIYFCDLCKSFLPRLDDQEHALAVHCRGSSHLRRYVKKKDDMALRKRAEKIHRLREEQRKALSKEQEKEEEEPMTVDAPEEEDEGDQSKTEETEQKPSIQTEGETPSQGSGMDDKTWTEVNKELGTLLMEVEEEPGNKSSDDEEDSRAAGRRYDRFKHSEKGNPETTVGESDMKTKSVEEKSVNAEVVNGGKDLS